MATFNPGRSRGTGRILGSQWGELSPHLIAKFFPVKRMASGDGWVQSRDRREIDAADKYIVDDGVEVHCPITDGNQEMTLNWQSPFENAGPESKAPALTAMLQSGALGAALQAFQSVPDEFIGSKIKTVHDALDVAVGRTGITKLNSTQIFSGMPPVKLAMTLHFRALSAPDAEVRRPIRQLEEWAVPQHLSPDGLVANAAKNGIAQNLMATAFPSVSPQIIGMQYADIMLMPVVIESIGKPFTGPRTKDGVMLSVALPITLATLTALDRRDIHRMYV